MLVTIPNGLDEIIYVFGSLDNPNFETENIVEFALPYPLLYAGSPVTHARAHRLAIDNLCAAFNSILSLGIQEQFQEFDGIYETRPIRGFPSHPSLHSWGVAIDMGASTHPLGSNATWPDQIMRCMKDAGFFWGGDFLSRKDPMHWQLATGY